MHLLLVEDEADTARYIRNGLKESGYTVTWSDNVAEGRHLALNERWDLILLDRMLAEGADGLSIVGALREAGSKTPVLILSALATLDERVRGLRGGGDDYLTKPFAFSELMARIEALLRRSGMREDARQLAVADLKLDLAARMASRAGDGIDLTPREFALLELDRKSVV